MLLIFNIGQAISPKWLVYFRRSPVSKPVAIFMLYFNEVNLPIKSSLFIVVPGEVKLVPLLLHVLIIVL